jgi:hypothetical protein
MRIAIIAGTLVGLTTWIAAHPLSYGQAPKFELVVPPGRAQSVDAAPIDLGQSFRRLLFANFWNPTLKRKSP